MELLKTTKPLSLTAKDLNKKELENITGGWCSSCTGGSVSIKTK